MTSANLEKTLEYLKIQENLRSENLTEHYLCEEIFLYVFLYPETEADLRLLQHPRWSAL